MENKYVWVLTVNWTCEEEHGNSTTVFGSYNKASVQFGIETSKAIEDFKDLDTSTDTYSNESGEGFFIYEKGNYNSNHIDITLERETVL